ncbi:MAG: hypothetical protein ABIK65_02285 [Candidatus Eisenbacteria bacterium]
MRRIRILGMTPLLLSLLLLPAGCGDDGGTGPNGAGSITVPIAVGNTWIYSVTTSSKEASTESDTTTIIGTETRYGETWHLFVDRVDAETTFVRQEGQRLFVVPPFAEEGSGKDDDPIGAYFRRVLEASLPWQFADFAVPSGTSWTLVDAETTFVVVQGTGSFEADVEISFRGASRGRTAVTVPAGSYTNAYEGEIRQLVVISTPAGVDSMTGERVIWVMDGVGLVKSEETSQDSAGGAIETTTEVLEGYTLH